MNKRTVLVISDLPYFRNYIWDRSDEMAKEHHSLKTRLHPGRAVFVCDEFLYNTYNSYERCDIEVTYHRIASAQALRGMTGPVELVWQDGYKPRGWREIPDFIRVINDMAAA